MTDRQKRQSAGPTPLPEPDAGIATVFAALAAALLLIVTGTALHLGAAVLARHRAESAADLAALAGAVHALAVPEEVCAAADRVASANGATLTSCEQVGLYVLIQVQVTVPLGALSGQANGRARAGPAAGSTAPG